MATSSVSHLSSLLRQSTVDDHEEVLRAANATLKTRKNDIEVQHVKVTALLKLDRFEDALRALESGGDRLKEEARLAWAYALYKSGQPAKAAEMASEGVERGCKHVEAQACYRIEDFKRAAEIYRELAEPLEEDAEADLRINSGAVDTQLEWAGYGDLVRKKKPAREDLEAFETAYNAACGSIARGELKQGEVLLKRAKDLCTALEDLADEEKMAEILPITVQQLYLLVRQGKLEEAQQLAVSVKVEDLQDKGTKHIAQVNKLASSAIPANPFLTQRLVSQPFDSLKPDIPFAYQSSILKQNQYVADLLSLKYSGVASSTQTMISQHPQPNIDPLSNSLSVFNAAAHAKSESGKEAIKLILPVLEKRPGDIGLMLTIVQLYVLTGNHASATSLMEKFLDRLEQSGRSEDQDVRFAPGLVGTTVSLYAAQRRRSSLQSELAKAAQHWRRKTKSPPTPVLNLLKAAGSALLDSSDPSHQELAKDIFTDLHARDPSDRYATAGLVASSPSSHIALDLSALTPVDRLTAKLDADALESAGIAVPPSTAPTTAKRQAEDVPKPKKRKRLTANRRVENYDPNFKADPERWLPLRDRSTYRPKGKKGKARQNLLSQGAMDVDSGGSRPGTPGGEVVKAKPGAGGGGGGAQNKKKKAKGGKK